MQAAKLRVLFATPAYWPAAAFGGPIWAQRELARGLTARGHEVEVVTTSLVDVHRRGAPRSREEEVDGARVHYLATPLHYRWMGVTPTLPLVLRRLPRPDVIHLFGFRDVVTTTVASWARVRRIPYVLEPLGMFRPRLRKVRLKQAFDATVARGIASGAAAIVVSSGIERDDVVASGGAADRVVVRGNGFPEPFSPERDGDFRRRLGIPAGAPIVLYVGRIAAGKGIELLLGSLRELHDVHLVLAGPDDRHGTMAHVLEAQADPATSDRVHPLGASTGPPLGLYGEADVLALPSAGESFGMAAAEAASAGTPVVLSDRCGVKDFFGAGEALVVPYDGAALTDALRRVLTDPELRRTLAAGGRAAAERTSWARVCELQEQVYRDAVASRTAATNPSTLGS
jgi:glycosyltransferase involved in cell wall biosynthesis